MIRSNAGKKHGLIYLCDVLVFLVMAALVYCGASWQLFETYTDAARYQCYALAFWQGRSALKNLPQSQCTFLTHPKAQDLPAISQLEIVRQLQQWHLPPEMVHFVMAQSPVLPWHSLPYEYPLLTILPFSLALIVPALWYQVAFAVCMLLVILYPYLLLLHRRSRRAAYVFALYLVVGCWATVAGRFDIVPATICLLALISAVRKSWLWAFALLALATMLKFYPLVLILPFFLGLQKEVRGSWHTYRRWSPLWLFVAVCAAIMLISLVLSVEGTLAPLSYFGTRPVQVESLSASCLWLLSLLGTGALKHAYTFGSLNVISPFTFIVSLLATLLLLMGLLYTYWLQWRQRIDLATACLLTLLIVMITSKVFSPQYLIWVVPFVAYIGGSQRWWLIPWVLIGLLTTWVYPYIYLMSRSLVSVPSLFLFYPVTTLRNLLLLGFILGLLTSSARRKRVPLSRSSDNLPRGLTRQLPVH